MEGRVWSNVIIPTIIRWAGCQNSPWNFLEDAFLEVLRVTCQHYINGTDVDLSLSSSPAFALVSQIPYFLYCYWLRIQAMQWLTDHWRSVIASSVLSIIHNFFTSETWFQSNEDHQNYAVWMLEQNHFVYQKAHSDDRRVMSSRTCIFLLMFHLFLEVVWLVSEQDHSSRIWCSFSTDKRYTVDLWPPDFVGQLPASSCTCTCHGCSKSVYHCPYFGYCTLT